MQNKNVYKIPMDVVKAIYKINQLLTDEAYLLTKRMEMEAKQEEHEGIYKELYLLNKYRNGGQLQGILTAQTILGQVLIGQIKFDEVEI